MYNATTVKAALINQVGWRQNPDPTGWQLTTMNASSSGLWYNGIHPVLSVENLISICPRFGKIYSTTGEINTAFDTWVKQQTEDGIIKAIEAWKTAKFEKQTAQNLLSRSLVFNVTGNITNLESSTGKRAGLGLRPSRSQGLIASIKQIGIQLTENQTIDLFLYKSGESTFYKTVEVVYTGAGSVQWVEVDWPMPGEGGYWLVYDQDTLVGSAINGIQDYTAYNQGGQGYPMGRYCNIVPFRTSAAMGELWDLSSNVYTMDTNYGLNLKMSVNCDYTDLIVEQKDLFKNLQALQVGMDLMSELIHNPESRVNRNQAGISKTDLRWDLTGDSQGKDDFSIWGQYKKALEELSFDATGIDDICLPCRKRGIEHSAIGPSSVFNYQRFR